MASLRDFTVQEVLNKRHVRYSNSGQSVMTNHNVANYQAISKPWSSIRCFNTGGDGTPGAAGNDFITAPFGSSDASGNLSGGEKIFTTHTARCDGAIAYDAATVAYDGATSEFPDSGTLYSMTYKDIDDGDTANDAIPCIQKLTYTGKTGTTDGNFTGVSGWDAHVTIGDAAQEEGLQDNMVLSLYKDENNTLVKGFPRGIEIYNTTAYPAYLKFNDPQSDTLVFLSGTSTAFFDEMTEVEDIFYGFSAAGGTGTVVWTLWY